jgi:hypothetical protein
MTTRISKHGKRNLQKTAESEDRHWWFIGRRHIVHRILDRLALPHNGMILEVGCGSGGNLPLLSRYGQEQAMELDEMASGYALKRRIGTIRPGILPDSIRFSQTSVRSRGDDRLTVEHVHNDLLSLAKLFDRLKPGGHVLACHVCL